MIKIRLNDFIISSLYKYGIYLGFLLFRSLIELLYAYLLSLMYVGIIIWNYVRYCCVFAFNWNIFTLFYKYCILLSLWISSKLLDQVVDSWLCQTTMNWTVRISLAVSPRLHGWVVPDSSKNSFSCSVFVHLRCLLFNSIQFSSVLRGINAVQKH